MRNGTSVIRLYLLLRSLQNIGMTERLRQEIELTKSSMLYCEIRQAYAMAYNPEKGDVDA